MGKTKQIVPKESIEEIVAKALASQERSWFRNNRWWLSPLGAILVVVVPWLINHFEEIEDQKNWRNSITRQVSIDSTNIIVIKDTLDHYMDNFNALEPDCYKK